MKRIDLIKITIAGILGMIIASLYSNNPKILVFIGATILIFIYFELAEQKPKRKTKSQFAKEMEKAKSLKIFKK